MVKKHISRGFLGNYNNSSSKDSDEKGYCGIKIMGKVLDEMKFTKRLLHDDMAIGQMVFIDGEEAKITNMDGQNIVVEFKDRSNTYNPAYKKVTDKRFSQGQIIVIVQNDGSPCLKRYHSEYVPEKELINVYCDFHMETEHVAVQRLEDLRPLEFMRDLVWEGV